MARPKNKAELAAEPNLDQDRINNAMAVVRQDAAASALVLTQRNDRVAALAGQLRYAGATDPSTLENSAREAIRRIGMGIFELGGYLLLLREACEHGTFLPALERLNLEPRAAQRYISVTRRFTANASTSGHLERLGMSKLTELLPLDDEQLEDLSELGQTGELKLDDVASMSVKDLRAVVRELRQEGQAKDALLTTKNEQLDKIKTKLRRIPQATPDEAAAELRKEATQAAFGAQAAVQGNLRLALVALDEAGEAAGDRNLHQLFMAGLVGCVQAELTKLRDFYCLPDLSSAADAQLAAEVAAWSDSAKS